MKEFYVDCCICKHHYDANKENDLCPICDWMYSGEDAEASDDEISSANTITRREAKINYAKSGNIWGLPEIVST